MPIRSTFVRFVDFGKPHFEVRDQLTEIEFAIIGEIRVKGFARLSGLAGWVETDNAKTPGSQDARRTALASE